MNTLQPNTNNGPAAAITPAVSAPQKLSMKMLYSMLLELHCRNEALVNQVGELELRLAELDRTRTVPEAVTAAAIDTRPAGPVEPASPMKPGALPEPPADFTLPCSEASIAELVAAISEAAAGSQNGKPPTDLVPVDVPAFRFSTRSDRHPKKASGFWQRLFRRILRRDEASSPGWVNRPVP